MSLKGEIKISPLKMQIKLKTGHFPTWGAQRGDTTAHRVHLMLMGNYTFKWYPEVKSCSQLINWNTIFEALKFLCTQAAAASVIKLVMLYAIYSLCAPPVSLCMCVRNLNMTDYQTDYQTAAQSNDISLSSPLSYDSDGISRVCCVSS